MLSPPPQSPGVVVPVQEDFGSHTPATPFAQVPYVQHCQAWLARLHARSGEFKITRISFPPGQNPGVDVPPILLQLPVEMHSPTKPLFLRPALSMVHKFFSFAASSRSLEMQHWMSVGPRHWPGMETPVSLGQPEVGRQVPLMPLAVQVSPLPVGKVQHYQGLWG
jgi:hypothetical protein